MYIPEHSDPPFRSKVTPHSGHSDPPSFLSYAYSLSVFYKRWNMSVLIMCGTAISRRTQGDAIPA